MKKILSRIFFLRHWPKKILLIFLVIILGGGYFFYTNVTKKGEVIEFVKVTRQDIKETVSGSGILTGKESANLKFKTSGKLVYLNVKTNDTVTKGQVIAGLDTQSLQIALQQAENTFRDKNAVAKKIEDDVKDSDKDETFTEKATRTTAQATRDSAFDAVKEARRAFQDAVLTSPMSGTVTQVIPVEGQNVSAADTIAQVVNQSEIYFDGEVDEGDIAKVFLDQEAEVSLNSYPGKVFVGKVTEIIPTTKTTTSGATVIVVRINLGNPDIKFIANTNGQVDIITRQEKNVLTIPQDSLVNEKQVYLKKGNSYVLSDIETGLRSDTEIEIKSGLSDSEEIVKNPGAVKKK